MAVRIRCRRQSYIRAGVRFKKGWNEFADGKLTDEQLAKFAVDPALETRGVEASEPSEDVKASSDKLVAHDTTSNNDGASATGGLVSTTEKDDDPADAKAGSSSEPKGPFLLEGPIYDALAGIKLKFLGDAWRREAAAILAESIDDIIADRVQILKDGDNARVTYYLSDNPDEAIVFLVNTSEGDA